jgi:Tfp pilus assembly protein PilN
MKWKLWVSNLSVSGPRVAVRTQLPFPLRALLALIALSLAFAAGLASSEIVRGSGGTERAEQGEDLDRLRSQLAQALADRDREAAAAVNWESRLKVEHSAQQQVRVQVKMLEDENARLKGDLAFFESLLPMPVDAKGVVIRSFRIQADAEPNSLRYRLLVQQSGRPERDFVGDVTLTINLQEDGRSVVVQLPDPAMPSAGPAPLSFRHYQRLEGIFPVPAGATVRSVLVRIRADGETRAQQTFTM